MLAKKGKAKSRRGTALNEIDYLGQNGSVPHSDGTRMEEIPAEAADAKCKGGRL